MKSHNLLRCALSLTGIFVGIQVASGAETFNFSVPGSIPGVTGFVKDYSDVAASGTVTFDGTTVTLFIENGNAMNSSISKVYLLKPVVGGSNIDTTGVSGVADWSAYNSLADPASNGKPGTILSSYVDWNNADYFGAAADSSSARIDEGNSATFTFTMASSTDAVNWLGYGDPSTPTIVIRWQEVGYNDRDGSTAGYGWLDTGGTVPPVPEPRLIAPLAVLGLGGLLMARRRLTRKGKKA
ncbi:hypothetical protein G0Q06_01530 [Puniceicoccales bacterium CK1056]|uniref:PEP-CTERM protein-sorting domain-containing protein n=1 Tax=Oceanipulchritudo coccoides TaxID=2706888 RepID=A0A6B2LYW2_9BACT|nr:hypothetical protein [Oceanipulchritudo coccoides]NDV61124.1 hypothetical protein [Oceanipulchritudo coccoides]